LKPIWLLDIDGVINANPYVKPTHVWDESFWLEAVVRDRNERTWPFMVSTAVINFIKDAVREDKVHVKWLTTWQKDAHRVSSRFGLPYFDVIENPMEKGTRASFYKSWWKLTEAITVATGHPGTPIIWTDDDLDHDSKDWFHEACPETDALLISPAGNEGLAPNHLAKINAFLKEHNS